MVVFCYKLVDGCSDEVVMRTTFVWNYFSKPSPMSERERSTTWKAALLLRCPSAQLTANMMEESGTIALAPRPTRSRVKETTKPTHPLSIEARAILLANIDSGKPASASKTLVWLPRRRNQPRSPVTVTHGKLSSLKRRMLQSQRPIILLPYIGITLGILDLTG